jgi:hypothetical protein
MTYPILLGLGIEAVNGQQLDISKQFPKQSLLLRRRGEGYGKQTMT